MLHFFRQYQRVLFLIMSVIVITSFSFFGTYSAFTQSSYQDEIVFQTCQGKNVKKSELEAMVVFLSTDQHDKLNFGGVWGPNFLNDGVFAKEFLETGLLPLLIAQNSAKFSDDLISIHNKEKGYQPYVHPRASFISAVNAWKYFAPEIPDCLENFNQHSDPNTQEAVESRVQLYLAERRFPDALLRRVLHSQNRQYPWVPEDQALAMTDLSLFGHRTLPDWIGPQLVREMCKVIINGAAIAAKKGYQVSRDEAYADLFASAKKSFEQLQHSPYMTVGSPNAYLEEQLRRMGMDQAQAIKIWQQVLLFRKLFHEAGQVPLNSTLAEEMIQQFTHEYVGGRLYHLPEELKLSRFIDLQHFQTYLEAVSTPSENPLNVPNRFLHPSKITKVTPSLVERRYLIEYVHVDTAHLQSKVGVKEAWGWEVDETHWSDLVDHFPELGLAASQTREDRVKALDALNSDIRSRVDLYARMQIVQLHPEWIEEALDRGVAKKEILHINKLGKLTPKLPIQDGCALQKLLDERAQETVYYAEKGQHYYRFTVIDSSREDEVLTFEEAKKNGALEEICLAKLEKHYEFIREKNPSHYQQDNGDWKPLKEMRELVAADLFSPILQILKEQEGNFSLDFLASKRLKQHVETIYSALKSNEESDWIREPIAETENRLSEKASLENQWKLLQTPYRIVRSQESPSAIPIDEAFALKEQEWSSLKTSRQGDLAFFVLTERGQDTDEATIAKKSDELQRLLSKEAKQHLFETLKEQLL